MKNAEFTPEQKERIIGDAEYLQYRAENNEADEKFLHIISCLKLYISIERGTYVEPKVKMSTRDYLAALSPDFDMRKHVAETH